jgi:hypothetical protein
LDDIRHWRIISQRDHHRNQDLYPAHLLYAYPRNEQEDLTAAQKKRLKQIVEKWTDE